MSLAPMPRLYSDGGETIGTVSIVTFRPELNNLVPKPERFLGFGSAHSRPDSAEVSMWFAQDDPSPTLLLGEDFFPWMILAFGAAMVVGNVFALARPPNPSTDDAEGSGTPSGPTQRPPLARSVVMIVVGIAASVWSLATLLT